MPLVQVPREPLGQQAQRGQLGQQVLQEPQDQVQLVLQEPQEPLA